jgi:alpha-L-fucosidase 2
VVIRRAGSAVLAFASLWCLTAHGSDLKLWYDEPAEHWVEALPIGNGSLGAMVFGGIPEERLQLNEDTLWTGSPHEYQHEGAAQILPELRRLLALGEQQAAEELAAKSFMSVPLHQKAYQPMGDLIIGFKGHDDATEYRRELDLENAITRVSYQIDGVAYRRDTISSFPDQVIAQRLSTSQKGALGFSIQLTTPHSAGRIDAVDGNGLLLTGQVENPSGEQGLRFAMQVRVTPEGGELTIEDGLITVSEANAVTILLSAATSYKSFSDISGDPVAATYEVFDQLQDKSFADILASHTKDYRELFDRMSIDLGTSERADLDTYERLKHTNKSDDPALAALLVQYGRYLLIASSRSGSQPANLQGIWNDQIRPRWGSKYTSNINVEMNYWPAEVANLSETAEPLFDMIDDLVISGRKTAKAHYDARGWVLHHNTDLWRASAPVNNSNHGIWPAGGAWLCQHLWERYLYTGDKVFLRERAYPVMKEAAVFFVDYLVEDSASGRLISGPSNSPEHGGLVMGPTMDHQIIRNLFTTVIAAAEILAEDPEFSAKLDPEPDR